VPTSTYRLQLQPGFGFAEAGQISDYLAALGVSHVYLSPILQAAPGSVHGYDVVDHSRVSADLGGEAAFRAMVARFRRHGLGVIADIVPNHMAIPVPETLNRQLWSVLCEGTGSVYAHWFDVDWQAQDGRLLLPILAGPVQECLGDLVVDRGQVGRGTTVLRYFGHVFPVRPETEDLPLAELLGAQHYRLASWRAAATDLNWRRFFDVTSLIAIRVEYDDVFRATHALLLKLMADGLIDGLRVDHLDGLADPCGYLDRLAEATGGAWVVTEKILSGDETLPLDWRCAGTTGYDALNAVGGLFVNPDTDALLAATYVRSTRGAATFADVAHAAKRETASVTFAAELSWLGRLLTRAGEPGLSEFSAEDIRTVLIEMLASFPVYRTYLVPGEPLPQVSGAVMARAAESARHRLPLRLHPVLHDVCRLLLGLGSDPGPSRALGELIVRFQQTCGPVMARGVEDCAFYRWPRLVALNEVGGEPDRFGISPERFHTFADRLARDWPATLTTLSTHDTKRQEDVRARLAVLSEMPQMWAQEVAQWHDRAARRSGVMLPHPDTEYLLWQTAVGAWPIEPDRAAAYMTKAMREARTRILTSWNNPNPYYEASVLAFVQAVLADAQLTKRISDFVARIAPDAEVNSLGAKLVQLTMPGIPDVYQGCELAGFWLVDPDNRRLVDYRIRSELLAALDADPQVVSSGLAALSDSATAETVLDIRKLLITSRTLRLRRDHPDWFTGTYQPLAAEGGAARHAIAFIRGGLSVTVATRLPAGLRRVGGWADTVLPLPDGHWLDVLTGASHAGPRLRMSAVTERLPVALLVPAPVAPRDR
jgi:(1->4)-alpha-D-glucan 1-alpha-D-glucosylmutase